VDVVVVLVLSVGHTKIGKVKEEIFMKRTEWKTEDEMRRDEKRTTTILLP